MAESQLYTQGDTIRAGSNILECSAVSHQQDEHGNPVKFIYQFRLQADVQAEREAEAAHQRELDQQAKGEEVTAAENAKLATPTAEQAALDEDKLPEAAKAGDESV